MQNSKIDMRSVIPMIPQFKVLRQVRCLAEVLDYNHRLMNIPAMWRLTMGEGVKLVILDTGVPNHPDLKPAGGKSFVPGYYEDKNGHSTHCGGIVNAVANNGMGVAGIAPKTEVYYGAVLDGDGGGAIENIVKGIYWAVDEIRADIISMSLGIEHGFPAFPEFKKACDYAKAKGVALFAAAGNEYGKVGQPACYPSVIAVAAVTDKMSHADFSNTGPEVDFAAGGEEVFSTYLNNSYAKLSGTSMACPALAALGALIKSEHRKRGEELTPDELKEHIRRIAFDVGPEGFDETFGWGIPLFRKGDDPYAAEAEPAPLPPAEDVPAGPGHAVKKSGIEPNCLTWRLALEFVEQLDEALNGKSEQQSLTQALRLSVGAMAERMRKLDAALRAKNKS